MRFLITTVCLLGAGSVAYGDGCRVAPVYHRQVFQKAVQVVTPVATFVPVTVAAYSTGYSSQGDQAQATREVADELRKLRETIASVFGNRRPPDDSQETTQTKVEALMAVKCASCHKPDVAKAKGGNHTLLTADGKLAAVNLFELWDEVDAGRMPKGGPELDADEVGLFKALLKEGIKAQKNGK